MKARAIIAFLMALGTALPLASCGGDDDDSPAPEGQTEGGNTGFTVADGTFTLDRKTGYGDDWIYVSLSTMDTIAVSEETHATDLSWDIAFNRYNIRTNSGTSGAGKGGAYKTGATKLSEVTAAPAADDFAVDTKWMITKQPTMSAAGVIEMESSANPLLSTAISIIVREGPPDYTIADDVFVIRGADGVSLYKFKTISFFNARGQSGYYSFMLEKMQ